LPTLDIGKEEEEEEVEKKKIEKEKEEIEVEIEKDAEEGLKCLRVPAKHGDNVTLSMKRFKNTEHVDFYW
jgi:hypothetical protein